MALKDRIRAVRHKQKSAFERLIDRVTCGDCMKLLPRVPDESMGLIVTDPPYGIDYRSNRRTKLSKFDRLDNDEGLFTAWLPEAHRVLKPGGALYVFTHWRTWGLWFAAVEGAGFKVKNMIVLHKTVHGSGDLKCYAPKHELLLFAAKGRHMLNQPEGRPMDVWDVKAVFTHAKVHPTQKPPEWYEPCVIQSSQPGDIVLDPFGGVAPCAVACKRNDRRFIVFEVEAHYCGEADRLLEKV